MKKFELENQPKISHGFIVPKDYFEHFSEKMLRQLPPEKSKVSPFFSKKKPFFFAMAAILLIGLSLPMISALWTNTEELDLVALENQLSYQTELSPYELLGELEQDDFDKMQPANGLKDELIEDVLIANSDLEQLILE